MTLNEAISKRIIMLCHDRGITIEQLTEKVNADPHAVTAAVKGHRQDTPLDLMGEICFTLGVTMSEFFHHSLFEGF